MIDEIKHMINHLPQIKDDLYDYSAKLEQILYAMLQLLEPPKWLPIEGMPTGGLYMVASHLYNDSGQPIFYSIGFRDKDGDILEAVFDGNANSFNQLTYAKYYYDLKIPEVPLSKCSYSRSH